MATANPFDLLGDDDNDDPSLLIAAQQQKVATKKPTPAPAGGGAAKLPSKPAPPAQAVKDARSNTNPTGGGSSSGGNGGGRGGPGRGRGGRGSSPSQGRGYDNGSLNGFSGGYGSAGGGGGEDGEAGKSLERERGSYGGPRQPYRGGRRGGYGNGEAEGDGRLPRRVFERHSGTGRGNELKREGSGRGNWGNPNDDMIAQEAEEVEKGENKALATANQPDQVVVPASDANKESKEGADNETEEKEPEDKEMTLDEYEKIREEKRRGLLALKADERKVGFDKDFESMQQLSLKKGTDEVFVKSGSEKDSRRKEIADRDERVKKSVSINEFLKPAEGGRYLSGGRGRSDRGQSRGGCGGGSGSAGVTAMAPAIDDPGHFPTLGGKQ